MKGIPALSKTTKAVALLLFLSSLMVIQGCSNSGALQFASHKVTMKRSGLTNSFGVEERGAVAVFHYDGYNLHGQRLKLIIENEKVMIDDMLVGHLKQGDSIRIADEGVAINSLDFGQTKEYLAASLKSETAQTVSK